MGKMSALNLFIIFICAAGFGFQASTLLNNMILNDAKKKMDRCILAFRLASISAATLANLKLEQVTSNMRTIILDNFVFVGF